MHTCSGMAVWISLIQMQRCAPEHGVPDKAKERGNVVRVTDSRHGVDAALLCLSNAKEGGLSGWSSSIAVHNEIVRRRPDLARVLAGPWFMDRKGEVPEGKKGYFELPVFNYHQVGSMQYFLSFPKVCWLVRVVCHMVYAVHYEKFSLRCFSCLKFFRSFLGLDEQLVYSGKHVQNLPRILTATKKRKFYCLPLSLRYSHAQSRH